MAVRKQIQQQPRRLFGRLEDPQHSLSAREINHMMYRRHSRKVLLTKRRSRDVTRCEGCGTWIIVHVALHIDWCEDCRELGCPERDHDAVARRIKPEIDDADFIEDIYRANRRFSRYYNFHEHFERGFRW